MKKLFFLAGILGYLNARAQDCSKKDPITQSPCSFHVKKQLSEISASLILKAPDGIDFFFAVGDGGDGEFLLKVPTQNPTHSQKLKLESKLSHIKITNQDWESMSFDSESGLIWIFDSGGNNQNKAQIEAYAFDPFENSKTLKLKEYKVFKYPSSHPYNDVEAAFIVHSHVYFIRKSFFGEATIFTSSMKGASVNDLHIHSALPSTTIEGGDFSLITDASFLGESIYFLSYAGIYSCQLDNFINLSKGETACSSSLLTLKAFDLETSNGSISDIQFEALAVDPQGDIYFAREEGSVFKL